MKLLLLLIGAIIHINGFSQKIDTLLVKQKVQLLLNNNSRVLPFSVSGDLYITTEQFIFHPKPYLKARYEMYNSLVNDIKLPYDSIISARKKTFLGGLEVKTKKITYEFAVASTIQKQSKKKLREIVSLVNGYIK